MLQLDRLSRSYDRSNQQLLLIISKHEKEKDSYQKIFSNFSLKVKLKSIVESFLSTYLGYFESISDLKNKIEETGISSGDDPLLCFINIEIEERQKKEKQKKHRIENKILNKKMEVHTKQYAESKYNHSMEILFIFFINSSLNKRRIYKKNNNIK